MNDSILCFGGSFNPIHRAHAACAKAAAAAARFGGVTLVPTGQPPHKHGEIGLASASDRLAMVRLVAQADPTFVVSDIELTTPGPHYTINTARLLRERTGRQIHWLIGADQLLRLPTWHDWQTLIVEVGFVVMRRPGYAITWKTLPSALWRLEEKVVEIPEIDISGTEIRRRVAARESIDDFVSPAVAAYIATHRLWR